MLQLHLPQCLTGDGRTPKEVGALPITKSCRFPASPYLLEECLKQLSRAVADVILRHQLLQLLYLLLLLLQHQNRISRTGGRRTSTGGLLLVLLTAQAAAGPTRRRQRHQTSTSFCLDCAVVRGIQLRRNSIGYLYPRPPPACRQHVNVCRRAEARGQVNQQSCLALRIP